MQSKGTNLVDGEGESDVIDDGEVVDVEAHGHGDGRVGRELRAGVVRRQAHARLQLHRPRRTQERLRHAHQRQERQPEGHPRAARGERSAASTFQAT